MTVEPTVNLGRELRLQGRLDEALDCFEKALSLDPACARAWAGMAATLSKLGLSSRAVEAYRQAIKLQPVNPRVYSALGKLYFFDGRADLAVDCLRQSLAQNPDHVLTRSNLAFTLNFDIRSSPEEIFSEHVEFGERHGNSRSCEPHNNSRQPGRPLKIGYVSGDLCDHPVGNFFEPIISHHGRGDYEITVYSSTRKPDAVTQRIEELAGRWRTVTHLSDESLAHMIREDAIDILVDLTGHTSAVRLGTFALKPAPIQVTYLGYPNTTGLTSIDYRITDANADPPGWTERLHVEKLIRLPNGFLCYLPSKNAPDVSDPPSAKGDHPTFGSCSKPAKWNREVIAAWAEILRLVPESRLLLHHSIAGKDRRGASANEELRVRVREAFHANGVAPDRVEICGGLGWNSHYRWFDRIDVALDPFPYAGTAATCETLWMGVPVVTLAGSTHVGRAGVSILSGLGFERLVARSLDDYAGIAASLASDKHGLARLRSGMRDRMRRSPLLDGCAFTRDLEDAYRAMWHGWVDEQARVSGR